MAWSEHNIGRALARQTFKAGLVVVPRCTWTGHECDLLVVTEKLMLVDVEIKISRADLKADAKKDKWWHRQRFWDEPHGEKPRTPVDWPPKVWKHYFAVPHDIWTPALFDSLPSTASGVILLADGITPGFMAASVERRAKPNPDAQQLAPAHIVDIARLASLRMWDAFKELEHGKS